MYHQMYYMSLCLSLKLKKINDWFKRKQEFNVQAVIGDDIIVEHDLYLANHYFLKRATDSSKKLFTAGQYSATFTQGMSFMNAEIAKGAIRKQSLLNLIIMYV